MSTTSPVPASRKQLTHDRIVDTAACVLRETGFGGVGVADVMKRSGLTHGGFYAHFASREALLAEALQRAGEDSGARLVRALDAAQAQGSTAFRALVESYLSERHLKAAETGCPVASLASDMPRQAESVRGAAAERVRSLIRTVESVLPKGHARDVAGPIAAQLVGALQLARVLGDNAAGRRQLAQSRALLITQFDSAPGRDG